MAIETVHIHVNRAIGGADISDLEELGWTVQRADGQNKFVVTSDGSSQTDMLSSLAFVDDVEACSFDSKLDSNLKRLHTESKELAVASADSDSYVATGEHIEILVALDSEDDATVDGLADVGEVTERSGRRAIVRLKTADLAKLLAVDGVAAAELRPKSQISNNIARTLTGVEPIFSDVALDGEGEIIGIADSGLDKGDLNDMLSDFGGRVIAIRSTSAEKDQPFSLSSLPGADLNNHGTHVAGSIAGDGASSNGNVKGMAPAAKITFLSMGPSPDRSLLVPLDLDSGMLKPAYDEGARIHSNSWGHRDSGGRYTQTSSDVDEFVWNNPDMLVVFAAGNDGDGPRTVSAPGTAKNCLTVGASESVRPLPAQITLQNNPQDVDNNPATPPTNFPLAMDSSFADDPSSVAYFSGRGPVSDGSATHLKPDIVAPGTMILSTRSRASLASTGPDGIENFPAYPDDAQAATHDQAVGIGLPGAAFYRTWDQVTPAAPNGSGSAAAENYYYSNGTSMATPIVSGCVALARQYLRTRRGIANPSAALLKALIINGASLPSGVSNDHQPDHGFGWIDMQATIAPDPSGKQIFVDESSLALATGESRVFSVQVADASAPLRATLVWTDPPGKGLQNKLYVQVIGPDGISFDGDVTPYPIPTNNVQRIHIETPLVGTYNVHVFGVEVAIGTLDANGEIRQAFALVVNNGIGTSPEPVELVQVLDSSGSMEHFGFMTPAKQRSRQLVDLLRIGDSAGIVSFNQQANIVEPLRTLSTFADQQVLAAAIESISSGGSTSIGAGLRAALTQLDPTSDRPQAIVLLSDGHENTPPWIGGGTEDSPPAFYNGSDLTEVLPQVPATVKIYTLSLGTASDAGLLQELALARGGRFFSVTSPADQGKLHEIYVHLQALASGEQVLAIGSGSTVTTSPQSSRGTERSTSMSGDINYSGVKIGLSSPTLPNLPVKYPIWLRRLIDSGRWLKPQAEFTLGHVVEVDESVSSLSFVVSWHNEALPVDLALLAPSLQRFDLDQAGVQVKRGPTYILVQIETPEPGTWRMDVTPAEDPGARCPYSWGAHGSSTIDLTIKTPSHPAGERSQTIEASLKDPEGLANSVVVSGLVMTPRHSREELVSEWQRELDGLSLPDEAVDDSEDSALKLGTLDLFLRGQGEPSIFRTRQTDLAFSSGPKFMADFTTSVPGVTSTRVRIDAKSKAGYKIVRHAVFDIWI